MNQDNETLIRQKEIDDPAGEGATLNNMAGAAQARGDYDTALDYLKQTLAILKEIDNRAGKDAMRERIWAGGIPVFQFPGGRKQFIDTQDLEAFISDNKRTIR